MAFQSTDKGRIIVKAETTSGEDEIDSTLDTVSEDLVYQGVRQANIITPERNQINPPRVKYGGAGSARRSVPNQVSISAEVGMTGLPADKDIPEWHDWFMSANMKAEVDVGVGVTYTPSQFTEKTLSIYEFRDNLDDNKARLQKTTGAVGSWSIHAALDDEIYFTWEGIGLYYHPGESASYYDSNGSLQNKSDGTTGFGSKDVFVTVTEATEGSEYTILVDGVEHTHTALALDTIEDIVDALVTAVNAGTADVTASKEGTTDVKITGAASGDRFDARIGRRETRMTIFARERWSDLDDMMTADALTVMIDDLSVELSSVVITGNTNPEAVRTITGTTGVSAIISSAANDSNTTVDMEILDGTESVYNKVMDAAEADTHMTLDITGGNSTTDLTISADDLQVGMPTMSASGNFAGWTVNAFLSGQWGDEIGGGQDLSVSLKHKA